MVTCTFFDSVKYSVKKKKKYKGENYDNIIKIIRIDLNKYRKFKNKFRKEKILILLIGII